MLSPVGHRLRRLYSKRKKEKKRKLFSQQAMAGLARRNGIKESVVGRKSLCRSSLTGLPGWHGSLLVLITFLNLSSIEPSQYYLDNLIKLGNDYFNDGKNINHLSTPLLDLFSIVFLFLFGHSSSHFFAGFARIKDMLSSSDQKGQ